MHAKRKDEEEEEGTKREREREREELFMAVREVISAGFWGGRLTYECRRDGQGIWFRRLIELIQELVR